MFHWRHVQQPGLTMLCRFTLALFLSVLLALPQVAQVAAAKAPPGPRSGHCIVTWTNPSTNESWLYVVGGKGNSGYSSFSRTRLPLGSSRRLEDNDWEALNAVNFTVVDGGACVIAPDNNYLVVIGGRPLYPHQKPRPWPLSFKDQAGVQVYNFLNDTWIPPLTRRGGLGDSYNPLMSLQGHVAVSVPSTKWVLVIGGNNHRNKVEESQRFFFALSMQSEDLWVWAPRIPGDRPKAVWQPGTAVFGPRLYMFGGTLLNEERPSREINIYDTDVSSWSLVDSFQLTEGACSMCQTAAGVTADGQSIYVIPGVLSTERRHPIQVVGLDSLGAVQDVSDVGDPDEPMLDAPLSGQFAYTQSEDIIIIYSGDTIYRYNMSTESWENRISTESTLVHPSDRSSGGDETSDEGADDGADTTYMKGSQGAAVWSIIVGSIVGALAVVFLIALLLYWRHKKRKEQLQYRDGRSTGGAAPGAAKRSRNVALSRSIAGGAQDDYSSDKSLPADGDLSDMVFLSKLLRRLSFLDRRYGNSQRSSNVNSMRSSQQSLEAPPDEDRTPPANGARRSSLLAV